jgi:hypothetical protein
MIVNDDGTRYTAALGLPRGTVSGINSYYIPDLYLLRNVLSDPVRVWYGLLRRENERG